MSEQRGNPAGYGGYSLELFPWSWRRFWRALWRTIEAVAAVTLLVLGGIYVWRQSTRLLPVPVVQDQRQTAFARRASLPLSWTNIVGMSFRLIPPGSCGEERTKLVVPVPIYFQTTEVPQWCYQMIMGTNPSYFAENPRGPVDSVLWAEAEEFCQRLSALEGWARFNTGSPVGIRYGYRLPTAMEWEYACRAGGGMRLPQNDRLRKKFLLKRAWFIENAGGEPHRVGERLPNPWGLYDMLGNVWEWTSDIYLLSEDADRKLIYDAATVYRVLKGGCWYSIAAECDPAYRRRWAEDLRWNCVGFRCVLVVPPGWFGLQEKDTGTL